MKKNLIPRIKGIKCTEENIRKYGNQVFAVFWFCTKKESHITYCEKVIVDKQRDWGSARDKLNNEVRSFILNDKDVWLLVE